MPIDFTWKIAGEAGYGIMSSGLIFSKTALRSGYFVFDVNEYPSLIRGGHNVFTTRVASREIFSQRNGIDFLVALNQEAIDFHRQELSERAGVIVNTDKVDLKKVKLSKKIKLFPLPLIQLVKKTGGEELMMNSAALGATIFLLKGDLKILEKTILDILGQKKLSLNIKSAKAGFNFAKENFKNYNIDFSLLPKQKKELLLLNGNDAISLGSIKAGLKFFACYPMTPINSILRYIAKKGPEFGIIYLQPEDEISAICMAIGASFAGKRAMVATSGGGFSLMVEAYGLAGMTETPLVIIEGQRPGPSTGLPTWTSQGDLRFVLSASQDEFPRIVLAPGDVEECFWLTIEAFNLADIYQTPVIILIDKHLAESHKSVFPFDLSKAKIERGSLFSKRGKNLEYKRYQFTPSGISPRAFPGKNGFTFLTNSDEHDEFGFSEESSINRIKMMEKRMKKMVWLSKNMPRPKVYGNKKSKITFISWGSPKGAILEAQRILKEKGIETNFLSLNYLNPFPTKFVSQFLSDKENIFFVEQNYSAQGAGLLREKTGIEIKNKILKYDGRPIFPEEIIEKVKTHL